MPVLSHSFSNCSFMHKSISLFLVVMALSVGATTFAEEVVVCDHIQRFRPKGSREVHLKMTFEKGIPQRFDYSGITASGEEGGAYSCALDGQRNDSKLRWETKARNTKIWLEENLDHDEPDIEILVNGKTTDVQLNITPDHYCGFGAEFPSRITKLPNGKCRVVF
jgi:hypothetical protein